MSLPHNQVLPFIIDATPLGGRVVRLHDSLNSILTRHNYPYAVSVLLGQFMTLGVSLATALKFDGVFTFEARGDGMVPLLVADITANGAIRGYAQIADRITTADMPAYDSIKHALVSTLMGTGHMMFTVDQMGTHERYQGIVALENPSWEQCMATYFEKSMQFQSVFRVACTQYKHGWVSGCIALQKMPEESQQHHIDTEIDTENEKWNRAAIVLKSITDTELTDINIPPEHLLHCLYHDQSVRVYPPTLLHDTCRCSRQKMLNAIAQIPQHERSELLNADGVVQVHCEYCATTQNFTADHIGLRQV